MEKVRTYFNSIKAGEIAADVTDLAHDINSIIVPFLNENGLLVTIDNIRFAVRDAAKLMMVFRNNAKAKFKAYTMPQSLKDKCINDEVEALKTKLFDLPFKYGGRGLQFVKLDNEAQMCEPDIEAIDEYCSTILTDAKEIAAYHAHQQAAEALNIFFGKNDLPDKWWQFFKRENGKFMPNNDLNISYTYFAGK